MLVKGDSIVVLVRKKGDYKSMKKLDGKNGSILSVDLKVVKNHEDFGYTLVNITNSKTERKGNEKDIWKE